LQFKSDIKVLPLSSYDMILGLDWLESHSPMQVHWPHQWLKIPYEGTTVQPHGLLSSILEGSIIQLCATDTSDAVPPDTWTPEIKQLLLDFDVLFQQPSQLPPSRATYHSIPLVQGAGVVFSRPYRFAPAVKDEIKKQVHEMLASGLIQKSSSPFSSPVLLVRKKDNT